MAKGLLQLKGAIDIQQFWPENLSDADTVTVIPDPDGFEFTPDRTHNQPVRVTHVFDEAVCEGTETKKVIHKGKVTVRLEHTDCAELHYSAPLKGTRIFRQFTAETATVTLHNLIASSKGRPVPCKVRTAVDHPNNVFDTYGRMIGSLFIYPSGKEINLNHWLIENGWAFPAFYNAAAAQEINDILALADAARRAERGAWACLSNNLLAPNFSLLFRPHGVPHAPDDLGPLVLPKLFRRQVLWHMESNTGKFTGTFIEFLKTQKDGWIRLTDYIQNQHARATPRTRDLSRLVDEHGVFTASAADIVFVEKPSTLLDPKGKRITSWWKTPVQAWGGERLAA